LHHGLCAVTAQLNRIEIWAPCSGHRLGDLHGSESGCGRDRPENAARRQDRVRRQTLRVTPAMEAGITDHVWTIAELLA
jgi:hypothetical protein